MHASAAFDTFGDNYVKYLLKLPCIIDSYGVILYNYYTLPVCVYHPFGSPDG